MADLEPAAAVDGNACLGNARPSQTVRSPARQTVVGQPWRTPQDTPPVRHQAETVSLVCQSKKEGSVGRSGREREIKKKQYFFL